MLWLVLPLVAQVQFHPVEQAVVMQRLEAAPGENAAREAFLAKMFADAGCQPSLQTVKRNKIPNVICILPGQTTDTIIVGAHMDHVERGKGIVDDWSGAALLPSLYDALKELPRHDTFVFVGFTDEEKGLVGSRSYVEQMSADDRARAKAMVNLECLGMGPTKVWSSHADPRLLNYLAVVAKALHQDLKGVNVETVGSADSESFAPAKVPRITIHSVTNENLKILHSDLDNVRAIHVDDYYQSYRLVAAYLAYLDTTLTKPAETNKAGAANLGESTTLAK
jgi:putative aminopeptidase FrvX